MTTKTTRAAFAALMLAASSIALSSGAFAQSRDTSEGPATRGGRPEAAKPAAKPAAVSLSAPVGRVLSNVQKLVGDKKFPEAMTALKDAQTAAVTDYDKLKVAQFTTVVAMNVNDEAAATAAAEAAGDLPEASIPAEDKLDVYRNAAALALNAKHNEKAVVYARQLIALNANDARTQQIISTAMYAAAPAPEAIAFFQKKIDATIAAGQKPTRDLIDMKINTHLKANDNPGAEQTLEQALLLFNDPKDWTQMIDVTMSTRGIRDIDAVMLGRLLFATGIPVAKENADLIGQTSQKLAMYGDAQLAQQKGATLQLDAARIAADKASMPEQIRMGTAQNGIFNVKLADALYGYGMYPQAEAAARVALTKGGGDTSEAQMVIAMSLYQQGKLPEAATAFEQVQGGSAATPRIARLWNTFIKTKSSTATASAAPAPAPAP